MSIRKLLTFFVMIIVIIMIKASKFITRVVEDIVFVYENIYPIVQDCIHAETVKAAKYTKYQTAVQPDTSVHHVNTTRVHHTNTSTKLSSKPAFQHASQLAETIPEHASQRDIQATIVHSLETLPALIQQEITKAITPLEAQIKHQQSTINLLLHQSYQTTRATTKKDDSEQVTDLKEKVSELREALKTSNAWIGKYMNDMTRLQRTLLFVNSREPSKMLTKTIEVLREYNAMKGPLSYARCSEQEIAENLNSRFSVHFPDEEDEEDEEEYSEEGKEEREESAGEYEGEESEGEGEEEVEDGEEYAIPPDDAESAGEDEEEREEDREDGEEVDGDWEDEEEPESSAGAVAGSVSLLDRMSSSNPEQDALLQRLRGEAASGSGSGAEPEASA